MTECTKAQPDLQLNFDFGLGKSVIGRFDGGQVSSDGGLVLVRAADEKLQLSEQIALCIGDTRQQAKVEHSVTDLVRQRLYMIAAGYKDLNDADRLAADGMHKICVGRNLEPEADLASDSTLGRLENGRNEKEAQFNRLNFSGKSGNGLIFGRVCIQVSKLVRPGSFVTRVGEPIRNCVPIRLYT